MNFFLGTLKGMGYKLNPYDTNKMVNGKQATIAWYVDDNKILDMDPTVVTDVINNIEARFGKMTVTRRKEHVFLGMKISFNKDGTVAVRMRDYVEEALSKFDERIGHSAATPARRTLFSINPKSEPLGKARSEVFHSIMAKLLYVSKCSHLDIKLAITFLWMRVSCSMVQDWSKLKGVLEYSNGTLDKFLELGADDMGIMETWVDASYAVHLNMKSHTGGAVSFGRGAVMSKSSKQKLNTKSYKEAELVGASDYLPYSIWAKKFQEAQRHGLKENRFYQDNLSTIRFEKNGQKSCGPNSRHIDIRYFWIKNRLELDSFDVTYCPTLQMLADFFTKPLQGSLFSKLRDVIMGHAHVNTLKGEPALVASQECVG
jgi:hypothetical protein